MQLQYSVFFRHGAWRVSREAVEVGSYPDHETALLTAQQLAQAVAGGGALSVVVQSPSGEVRTLRVGAPAAAALG